MASFSSLSPKPVTAPATAAPDATLLQVSSIQNELDSLKGEVNLLRRRDETLKFYLARLDEELRLAAKLQQDFLPRHLPEVGPVRFHTLFRPAGYVSGDLYDVMRLDETHLGVFLVDAVGHGMPAALLTMFIKRALKTKEIFPGGYRLLHPEQTMVLLNDALIEQDLPDATFATSLYGMIDLATLQFTFCSGGHPPPLLQRGGQFETLSAEGGLLGIFSGETYSPRSVDLQSGDRLIIYSDGVEVAFSADQGFNTGQWKRELQQRCAMSADAMLVDFAQLLDSESGSLQPKDDLTMIVVDVA
jgi:sigma-B regulation protein RsbU (phosphoserine phosphatase)